MASRAGTGEIPVEGVISLWDTGPPFSQIGPYFCLFANTEHRLQLVGSTAAFDVLTQPPTAPLQVLYLTEELEKSLAEATSRAFRRPVTVNRVSGSQIHLHIGEPETEGPPLPTNAAYRDAISRLPLVQNEGDGVRSYVGVLLAVTAARYPIVLIDEPEAFLHPPQERQLGRELASLVAGDTQLMVSTHSSDFLQGVLDNAEANVTVVRLTRDGSVNHAAILARERLSEVWSDPLLRYSALLDGLFHAGVVLCEGDADCRFYQATLDSTLERAGQAAHDLLFTHTGGKHRLPTAIPALKAIGVPVQVVADFDLLADQGLLRRTLEALDGDWTAIERDWRVVKSAVEGLGSAPSVVAVKEEVQRALENVEGAVWDREHSRAIRELTRIEDGWTRGKRGGLSALPQGDAAESAERLVGALRENGLHVVPVGELERWASDIGGHGPEWVASALEKKAHEREGPHRDFALQLM